MTVQRFPKPLIILHWFLALVIIGAWLAGNVLLEDRPNSDPNKLLILGTHAYAGITIGLFMIVRLIVRLRGPLPESVNAGHKIALNIEKVTQLGFYLVVLILVFTGMKTLYSSGALPNVLSFSGELPNSFDGYLSVDIHGIMTKLLLFLVLIHVAAVIKHRVVSGTSLMKRMSLRD